MPDILGDNPIRAIALLVFVGALLLFEGLYLLWKARHGAQARQLSRRLQALARHRASEAAVRVTREGSGAQPGPLARWLSPVRDTRETQQLLQQAGIRWPVHRLALVSVALGVAGFFGANLLLRWWPAWLLAGIGCAFLPLAYAKLRRRRRLARILQQFPDALDFITRALRSGHSFTAALMMCGEELPDPIGAEFRAVHDEITFGVSLESALGHLCERLPMTDVRYFMVAVLIQRESGGNLVEILTSLSQLIRGRQKLFAKVRILSAEGRLSAWILAVMPFGLGAVMQANNPKFMSLLWTDSIGQTILKALAVMMVTGMFIMHKIVKIRV